MPGDLLNSTMACCDARGARSRQSPHPTVLPAPDPGRLRHLATDTPGTAFIEALGEKTVAHSPGEEGAENGEGLVLFLNERHVSASFEHHKLGLRCSLAVLYCVVGWLPGPKGQRRHSPHLAQSIEHHPARGCLAGPRKRRPLATGMDRIRQLR